MKKTYFTPVAKTIDLEYEGLVAGSNDDLGSSDLDGTSFGGTGSGDADSNRRGIWDNTEW